MAISLFQQLFSKKKPIIAMLHLFEGELQAQIGQALEDLTRLQPFVDGAIVENYDCGYFDENLATEEMAETLAAITKAVISNATIPIGLNVLPNDYEKAFQICGETGAKFVQLDHVTGEFVGCRCVYSRHLLAVRSRYPDIVLLGGIHPKYYELVNPDTSIAESAITAKSLTDVIVATGEYTGGETKLNDIRSVKEAIGNHPLIIGSGLSVRNAVVQLSIADGAIVGTAFKRGGVQPGESIDVELVKQLMDEVVKLR